jgi:hypothetical protein
MTEQEKIKYAYECMVKNNPDEAVKQLLLKDKMIINKRKTITKAIEYIENNEFYLDYKTGACIKGVMPLLDILRGEDNE